MRPEEDRERENQQLHAAEASRDVRYPSIFGTQIRFGETRREKGGDSLGLSAREGPGWKWTIIGMGCARSRYMAV